MKIADKGCVIMRSDTGYAYLPAKQAEIEFAKYKQQITALEKQCATLAAQIDRMTSVVDAACNLKTTLTPDGTKMQQRLERLILIHDAVDIYEQQMAALAKGTGE